MTSESACRLACEIESEFLCRSFLYLGQPQGAQYNCRLYHLDHKTLPDGPSTYLNHERPLIDHGEPIGQYFENQCEKSTSSSAGGGNSPPGTLDKIDTLPVSLDTIEDPNLTNMTRNDVNCDKTGTCYDGESFPIAESLSRISLISAHLFQSPCTARTHASLSRCAPTSPSMVASMPWVAPRLATSM